MAIEKITWLPVKFNYAILKTQKPFVSQKLRDDLKLNLFYDHAPVPFRHSRNLILEFDKNIIDFMDNGDATLNIHIHLKNGDGFINIDKNIYDFDNIGEKYYYVILVVKK